MVNNDRKTCIIYYRLKNTKSLYRICLRVAAALLQLLVTVGNFLNTKGILAFFIFSSDKCPYIYCFNVDNNAGSFIISLLTLTSGIYRTLRRLVY